MHHTRILRAVSVVLAAAAMFVAAPRVLANISFLGTVDPDPTSGNVNGDLAVGFVDNQTDEFYGELNIGSGAAPTTLNVSDTTTIGEDEEGIGRVTVTGTLARLNTDRLSVGLEGTGLLEIFEGGSVFVEGGGTDDAQVGDALSGSGRIVVNGFASQLWVGRELRIGVDGIGILQIEDDGLVDNHNGGSTDMTVIGSRGRLELDSGRLLTTRLENDGVITGSGRLDVFWDTGGFDQRFTSSGRIEIGSGDLLTVDLTSSTQNFDLFSNAGVVELDDGELVVVGHFQNENSVGEITLQDATLRVSDSFANGGLLAATFGASDIYGGIQNEQDGEIVVAGEGGATFHDAVTNDGRITVFPGSTGLFLGGVTSNASGNLVFELAGTNAATDFGQMEVVGAANMGGMLEIHLAGGFTPTAGDAFTILSTTGGVIETFAATNYPTLPGNLGWMLDTSDPNSLTLRVVADGLVGDYNDDGKVSAADFTIWQDTFGSTTDLRADGNGNHVIDAGDYDEWKMNYGSTGTAAGSGAVGAAGSTLALSAVPEPGSLAIALAGLVLIACHFSRNGGATVRR